MTEIWKAVVGFEGAYEVSNLGRVQSLDRSVIVTGRCGAEIRRYAGKVLRQNNGGTNAYLTVALSKNGHVSTFCVHALVASAFLGPCPPGQEIRHFDGDDLNNAETNLRYGTRSENREDSRRLDRLAVGERIAQHKLTNEEVLRIRATKASSNRIAGEFGVTARQIRRVRSKTNWAHL